MTLRPIIAIILLSVSSKTMLSNPRITSWFTDNSGAYARIYETLEDEINLNSVTTWSRGAGVQTEPTYAGIHEVSRTEDWVYIRTTNLASHIMGPWYLNQAKTNLFPNYPSNQSILYRLPLNPVDPNSISEKALTGGGPIGYFVNGVSMFDSRDAFSYRVSTGSDAQGARGDGAWNRDAYVNEGVTFDSANAHQAMGRYHYHANPPGLRNQLGDSVDYDSKTNTYIENFNGQHSPVLAWSRDGLPVYGPYGYSDPLNSSSEIRRMRSGFKIRSDIEAIGSPRSTWPLWATRIYDGIRSFASGPNVSSQYPLGRYMEDNDYLGDLGQILGIDFDLNEFNVRYCVTPEFPKGTWAYFVCIDEYGTPVFPYNIGRSFFGDPVGDNVTSIPANDESTASVVTVFEGGPESPLTIKSLEFDDLEKDEITFVWSGIEGATYEIQASNDIGGNDSWDRLGSEVVGSGSNVEFSYSSENDRPKSQFYRVKNLNLAAFDDRGFNYTETPVPISDVEPSTITVSMTGGPENLATQPISLWFAGKTIEIEASNVFRPNQNEITFDFPIGNLDVDNFEVLAVYANEQVERGTYKVHANILLMIVDDWGIDASSLYNDDPSVFLAKMPNLQTLADEGLLFNRAYSQPLCSPTRATILTGRQPHQHNVGTPQDAMLFSNHQNEITLPEIFSMMGSPYKMISVGKWHLGGQNTGYRTRGGWPEFYGINSGGVQDYYDWSKNTNGTIFRSTTYTTTDQVDQLIGFIENAESAQFPWFAWAAFNAPHTPFHDPPLSLAPENGYSPRENGETINQYRYRKALEALDSEIGRLIRSIDQSRTQIIVFGDNGTPNQVVQSPFGNGNSKGDLYNGGIHVPMIAHGPWVKVQRGSETGALVHCIDLFSTILDLAGIDEFNVPGLSDQNVSSRSILPILVGTDTEERFVIAERTGTTNGRAIIMGNYSDYKLIIFGDPASSLDTPVFEFYNIGAPAFDINEQDPLDIQSLEGVALAAYKACLAKDREIGGGYSNLAQ